MNKQSNARKTSTKKSGGEQSEDEKITNSRQIPEKQLGPGGQVYTEKSADVLKKIQEEVESKHFSRIENMQHMVDELRDSYIKYKEYARLCKIKLAEGGGINDQINKFYYKPKVQFLKKPEKQRMFRKDFIEEIGKLPEPEPLYLMADTLHQQALETVADRKSPSLTKQSLCEFYQVRFTYLQHKKYKLLHRWANTQINSQDIEANEVPFSKALSNLQLETDSVIRRIERLSLDDKQAEAAGFKRPIPTISEEQHAAAQKAHEESLKRAFANEPDAKLQMKLEQEGKKDDGTRAPLYVHSDYDKSINSAIRLEDIEVFMRVRTYQDKIKRLSNKLTQQIKWLPFSQRYEMWSESRAMINDAKKATEQEKSNRLFTVTQGIKELLRGMGVQDDKTVQYATERYTYHLQGKGYQSRIKQMEACYKFDMQTPFMLQASDIELKLALIPVAKEYKISCEQVDRDKGQQFNYQLQIIFPTAFEKQVAAMQFDWEDSGYDADFTHIERLSKNLGLTKVELLKDLSKFGDKQRRIGILNALKNEKNAQQAEDDENKQKMDAMETEEFSKQTMLRRLRTIEFFTLDVHQQKLRKADWLAYVCFEPNINDSIARQNMLLSGDDNEIDSLLENAFQLVDINESTTVNKIIEQAANDHITKIADVQDTINQGTYHKGRADFAEPLPEDDSKSKQTEEHLRSTVFPAAHNQSVPLANMSEQLQNKIKKLSEIPNVNPIGLNTLKAFYTLRLMKTRDTKIKLLSVLNYFRAIQRLLTFDMKEFYSRERSLGETSEKDRNNPYFGKDAKGRTFASTAGNADPGSIFATHIGRDLDRQDHYTFDECEDEKNSDDEQYDDPPTEPIDLKAYKYHNKFNPLTTSTCPLVPKHHRTFGKQTLFEQVQDETDRMRDATNNPHESARRESRNLIEKKDRIFVDMTLREIKVTNEFGMPIMYEEALSDMVLLEEEMIKIGSFYINKYEDKCVSMGTFTMKSHFQRPSYLVDRPEFVKDIFDKEMDFQFQKVKLIEVLMEAYEHTCEPLENVRLLQIIVDTMAHRPRLNTDGSMYQESYKVEIDNLKLRTDFFAELIKIQKTIEKEENDNLHQFQEMKCRKMQDFMNGDWEYQGNWNSKVEREGSLEEASDKERQAALLASKGKSSAEQEADKKRALDRIGARHITEFANEQYTDFSKILGLPNITMEELNEKQPRRDPIVIDALREMAFYEKQREGYPAFFSKIKFPSKDAGLHSGDIGVTDFFDSLSGIATVNAALAQGFNELRCAFYPENGFAESCLEKKFLEAATFKLKKVHIHIEEQTPSVDLHNGQNDVEPLKMKGARNLEQDFFLGNSDKLVFAMREFASEMHPDVMYQRANPMVVAQLDIQVRACLQNQPIIFVQSVQNFNFPRLKQTEVIESLEGKSKSEGDGLPSNFPRGLQPWDDPAKFKKSTEEEKDQALLHRMIDLAKNSVSRQVLQISTGMDKGIEEAMEAEKAGHDKVRGPSMLKMACNIMEVNRMREELIRSVHETSILSTIYHNQAAKANRSKLLKSGDQILPPSLLPEAVENANFVDNNDGTKLDYDIAFSEFDKTLNRNLDFKSESCIKSLMTDMGCEELRAVLHYQLMQQQLLTVAVHINTLLLDGTLRGMTELELLQNRSITVPDTVLDLNSLFYAETGGYNAMNAKKCKELMATEMQRKMTDCMMWILPRKRKHSSKLPKIYNAFAAKLNLDQGLREDSKVAVKLQSETKMRILRAMRVKLMHRFCKDVLKDVYSDSLKIQNLDTCNDLRLRSQLFPTEVRLFQIGLGINFENQKQVGRGTLCENLSFDAVNRQLITDFRMAGEKEMKVEDILHCQFPAKNGILYIPSSIEIMMVDRSSFDEKANKDTMMVKSDDTKVWDLEKEINNLVSLPTRISPQYQQEGKQKFANRKITFKEAYSYTQDSFNLLQYFSLNLRVLNLEYIMSRNSIPSSQVLAMESRVLAGVTFWTEIKANEKKLDVEFSLPEDEGIHSDDNDDDSEDEDTKEARKLQNMSISERVIRRVVKKKKGWVNLALDMTNIGDKIQNINKLIENIPADQTNISYVIDVLTQQHHNSFYQLINGLETVMQDYVDKNKDDYFQKATEVRNAAMKRQHGIHMFVSNGYYVTQASTSPLLIPLTANKCQDRDFETHQQAVNPVIDENAMVPNHVTAVERMYGDKSRLDHFNSQVYYQRHMRNYANLQNAFLNVDDEQRNIIGNNLNHIDDAVEDYLIYKGLLELPEAPDSPREDEGKKDKEREKTGIASVNLGNKKSLLSRLGKAYEVDLLAAKVEFLTFKIETCHLKRIFMSWLNQGRALPTGTVEFKALQKSFEDTCMYRVLVERDILNEIYWMQAANNKRQTKQTEKEPKDDKKIEGFSAQDKRAILENINIRSPEYIFFNKINMVRAEGILIKHLFEVQLIKIGVKMITNEHSAISAAFEQSAGEQDVQYFVHPNQQFAGTLFQDVDKLAHLNVLTKLGFAQSFMTRLRNRCTEVETLTSKAIVFTMKDFNECLQIFCKQILKYGETEMRTRCETAAVRENQYRHLIYIKEMEGIYYRRKCEQFLMNVDAIINAKLSAKGNKMIYEHDMTSRELRCLKDNYYLMEAEMRNEVKLEFSREIATGKHTLKRTQDRFMEHKDEINTELNKYMSYEIQTQITKVQDHIRKTGKAPREMTDIPPFRHKDPDGQEEILGLLQHIRKFKTLTVMKSVTTQERHEKEILHMKDQLSQNQVLWDQLAEAEKREQITRQELELTKQNLVSYEKLISKLYEQLEHLNNQKMRLLQYKNSKAKRIGELEAKMREIDILESIDLNKILEEMRLRDRKLTTMTKAQNHIDHKIDGLQNVNEQKMEALQKKYEKEHEAKMDAFEKLESMRLEIKTLEGKDMKNDLWKDKCKELYDMCAELEKENDSIKHNYYESTNQLEIAIKENEKLAENIRTMSIQTKSTIGGNSKVPTLRESMILGRHNVGSKPMTAGNPGARVRSSVNTKMNSGKLDSRNQQTGFRASHNNVANDWTSITSNVSFPGLSQKDPNQQHQVMSGRVPAQNHGGGFRNDRLQQNATGPPGKNQVRNRQTENNLQLAGNNVRLAAQAKRYAGSIEQIKGGALSESMGNPTQYSGGAGVLSGNIMMAPQNPTVDLLSVGGQGPSHAFQINPKRLATSQGQRGGNRQAIINASQGTHPTTAFGESNEGWQRSQQNNAKGLQGSSAQPSGNLTVTGGQMTGGKTSYANIQQSPETM